MHAISNFFHCTAAFVYGFTTYTLFDRGLSKTLALEELTHGTDPISNIKIRFSGGQPSKPEGKPNYPDYKNTINYLYLYKDREFGRINGKMPPWEEKLSPFQKLRYHVGKTVVKRIFLIDNITNASILKHRRYLKKSETSGLEPADYLPMISGLILSPIIRFRFSKIDPTRLEEDTNHPGLAYKTNQIVEPWRIGPIGSCLTGLNPNWLSRVKDDPLKALAGVAQLTSSVGLLFLKRSQIVKKLPWAIVGALLS